MTRLRGASRDDYVRPESVPEGSIVSVFRVPPEVAGQRLDVFVQSQLRRTSRTRTQRIIELSAYDPDGRRLRANDRVRAEQQILLWRAPWDETPVPRVIDVLYEDEHLLAVDKPALLPVHPTARYHNNTLIKLLQAERPGQFLRLGHRIDRETSGVLLVAKTAACERALKRQLEARDDIEKTYVAVTWGVPAAGRCEVPLELDLTSPYKVQMRAGSGMTAATVFTIEATSPDGRYARVRCDLETGRQHQIRVHLATLGTPIVGDKLYGPDASMFARGADGELTEEDVAKLELPRHALHAARIALPHPVGGEPLEVIAPLPRDLADFWASVTGSR